MKGHRKLWANVVSQVPVKRKMEFDLATCRYVWGFDIKKDMKQGKGVPAMLTKVDKVKGGRD